MTELPLWIQIVAAVLLVVGGVFALVGAVGLLRFPDFYMRLHAPTKATTLGVGGVLIASMIHAIALEGKASFHELLITLFLFLTAPITANFIAKVHIHRNETPQSMPPAGEDRLWATHDVDKETA